MIFRLSKNNQNAIMNKLNLIANELDWEILNPKEIFKGINENSGIFNLDRILIKLVKTSEYRKSLIIIPVKIWSGSGYFRYNSGSINYSSSKGKISDSLRKRSISEGLYPLKNSRNELTRSFLKYSGVAKKIFQRLDLDIEARIEPKRIYYTLNGHKLSISIKPMSLSQNGGRFIPEDDMTLKIPEISGFGRIINSNFGYYPVFGNYFVNAKSTKKFLKYITSRVVAIENIKNPQKKDSFPDFTNLNMGFGIITTLLGLFSTLSVFLFPDTISNLMFNISIIMFVAVLCAYFYLN